MSNGTLQIDIREHESYIERLQEFASTYELDTEVGTYDVGDYIISSKLGIEFKSHNDFLGSFGERLLTQAHELASQFERPVILVGSTLDALIDDGRHSEEAIRGFVASLMVREGCMVLFCGPDHIPMVLKLAQKATTETNRVYNPMRRGGTKGEFGVGLIASLPGVGMKRAQKIVDHFGSPLNAIVSVAEWTQLDGIGQKTVDKCIEVLIPTEGSSGGGESPDPTQEGMS